MSDEDLIGYLVGALDPSDQATVDAHLRSSQESAERLEQLRLSLKPLESAREPDQAPRGLAVRTIARLASHLVEHEPRPAVVNGPDPLAALIHMVAQQSKAVTVVDTPVIQPSATPVTPATPAPSQPVPRAPREEPETRVMGGRFRPDLIVACGIALLLCGLVFSAIGKVRVRYQIVACQENLQSVYRGLSGYADTHDGCYPQIGPNDTADSFARVLVEAGQVPADFRAGCPSTVSSETSSPTSPVSYTYSLGYQTPNGSLTGIRRPDNSTDEHDLLPISSDYPTASATPGAGPLCPHPPQMNVLFAGGQVRITTSPLIGPNGDDIYRNIYGAVTAGINSNDVVLGRPGDHP